MVHEGHYHIPSTVTFTEQDSGTEAGPIRYRSVEGESVILCGGWKLDEADRVEANDLLRRIPTEARPNVRVYQIKGRDLETAALQRRALGIEMAPAPIELFSGAGVLPRAGWPIRGLQRLLLKVTHGLFQNTSIQIVLLPLGLTVSGSRIGKIPSNRYCFRLHLANRMKRFCHLPIAQPSQPGCEGSC